MLAALSRLLGGGVSALTDDELIAAVRASVEFTQQGREVTGQLLAALYERDRLSWPQIANMTGMATSTAHLWAQPYLCPDAEQSPRQGRRQNNDKR